MCKQERQRIKAATDAELARLHNESTEFRENATRAHTPANPRRTNTPYMNDHTDHHDDHHSYANDTTLNSSLSVSMLRPATAPEMPPDMRGLQVPCGVWTAACVCLLRVLMHALACAYCIYVHAWAHIHTSIYACRHAYMHTQ
jgi:hypothetical protein